MPATDEGARVALESLRGAIATVGAFTADPGAGGSVANEVSGGSYARQPMSFNAAASRNLDSLATPSIPIPAGTTVTHLGFFNPSNAMIWRVALASPQTFSQAGDLDLSDFDISVA